MNQRNSVFNDSKRKHFMIYQFCISACPIRFTDNHSLTWIFCAYYLFKVFAIRLSAKLFFFNYFAVDVSIWWWGFLGLHFFDQEQFKEPTSFFTEFFSSSVCLHKEHGIFGHICESRGKYVVMSNDSLISPRHIWLFQYLSFHIFFHPSLLSPLPLPVTLSC